ncbi:MAG: M48 family metallopeptidase [Burkholderiaceae bacterium]|jgi:predicted Zn-dependent protease|nr:M48 family metallopeptidase [Burkholderiales bacterium]MCZ8337142.1 M48 family metallopeptidase [Burkholderiaceae bacterium]
MTLRMPGPRALAWIAAATVALSAGCQSVQTTSAGAVGVDRKQSMSALVSEADLRKGSEQAYAQLMSQARQKGALNADAQLTQRVRAIAQRMIPTTAAFRPDAPAWKWEVNVLQSDQLNAWCMPGGKIAFYSGIITRLNLTDDEIAAIMGHEIAHALREHARERASEQQAAGLVIGVGAALLGVGSIGSDLGQMAYKVAVGMPNSRAHETEADRIGVELAARSGYDPRAAIVLWQKMAKASGNGGPPQFLSTHPSAETRQQDLAVYAERVMPLYQQARK